MGILLLDYLLLAVPFQKKFFYVKQNLLALFSYRVIDKVTNIFYNKPMPCCYNYTNYEKGNRMAKVYWISIIT